MGGTGSTLARALSVRFYAPSHASLHSRPDASRQARLHHGGQRRDGDLPPARPAIQPHRATFPLARASRPATTSRCSWRTTPRFFEICWGAQRSGLIYTAISSRLTAAEVDYIVGDCGAKLFVTSKYLADKAAELAPLLKGVSHRYMIDGTIAGLRRPGRTTIARLPATPIADETAGHDMLYSSGTTGRPKGVLPVRRAAGDRLRQSAARHHAQALRHGREHGLSLAGAALSRGSAALQHERHAARRHVGDHGAFRRRGVPDAGRQAPDHAHPARADHVRALAQAARRGAR